MNANRGFNDMREPDEHDDDLDYEEDQYESGLLRWMSIAFVLFAVGGFVALAWYAYQSGMEPASEADIPLVEADAGDVKSKPENPGGLQFDHQDKSVYNELATGESENVAPVAERLLPPPEEPVARDGVEELLGDKPAAGSKAEATEEAKDAALAAVKEEKPAEVAVPAEDDAKSEEPAVIAPIMSAPKEEKVAEKPAPKAAEPEKAIIAKEPVSKEKPAEKKVTIVPSTKSEEKMAVIESKPAAKPAPKEVKPAPAATTSKAGPFMVQLGALSSRADADATWGKLVAKHGGALPSQQHAVEHATVNGREVYRLQMGPFPDDASARNACSSLQQKQKQACFVVKAK